MVAGLKPLLSFDSFVSSMFGQASEVPTLTGTDVVNNTPVFHLRVGGRLGRLRRQGRPALSGADDRAGIGFRLDRLPPAGTSRSRSRPARVGDLYRARRLNWRK